MIPDRKICGDCKIEKDKAEFPLRKKKNGYTWLRLQCYECMRIRKKVGYDKNKEVIIARNKLYVDSNKEKVYARQKEWRTENDVDQKERRKKSYSRRSDGIKEKRKEYYYLNKEQCIASVNEYVKNNTAKVRKCQRVRHNKRVEEDLSYKMIKILRSRVYGAVKNKGIKCTKTMNLVGCSMDFLINHLESKFTDGMSWENQGFFGWHIDHIKPCSKFNMALPEEQKKAFHYSNLQPLWWIDNFKKGDKWEEV